ncbi:2-C-methyl-D-erythritol 4-phosphate cytidylyltransferase [Caldinitratiruptor microaerophilus]|uniref:2-C-methyl-D-erythritol 4-phosphate cytidylyltransferase n=1 Tax=Caldinitratiruptor microaerophilus TaxID=671077 RepID=A0AA35CQ55_9FIRM|nr:2-C-methyl-D-erythritol 4-phosphate cytidylyltransferase [Caldinitratiruptor microaerophilus]BDG62127.1 2-C-methyl-D-erythritol 4-phosphate cytidylyltransferase [Caldinitratiruptor microaerophilus]
MTIPLGPAGLAVGVTAIVAAGGRGTRVGGPVPKQFLDLAGRPVLVRSLEVLAADPRVDELVVAAPPGWVDRVWELARQYGIPKLTRVVEGGETRQESVGRAFGAVSSRPRVVAIHDAARPLLPPALLAGLLEAAGRYPAVIAAVPVRDTVKEAAPGDPPRVARTLARERLWAAQTPQVFHAHVLEAALARAREDGFTGTDEAALVERLGEPVVLYPGSAENLKLTTPEDFALAGALLARRHAAAAPPAPA